MVYLYMVRYILIHKRGEFIVTTEKELGEALKRGESRIEVECDLVKRIIKIKAVGNAAWAICIGAIGVAAVCGAVIITSAGTATAPSAFVAAPALVTVSSFLGVPTAISAIGIAIAGGGVGALNKLRGYRVEKVSDEKIILHKK